MTNQEELRKLFEMFDRNPFYAPIGRRIDAILSAGYVKKDSIELDEEKIREIIANTEDGVIVIDEDYDKLAHAIACAGKEVVK